MLYNAYMPTGKISVMGCIYMKTLLRRKNVFEKSEMTINWVKTLIGEVPEEDIIRIFGHSGITG